MTSATELKKPSTFTTFARILALLLRVYKPPQAVLHFFMAFRGFQ